MSTINDLYIPLQSNHVPADIDTKVYTFTRGQVFRLKTLMVSLTFYSIRSGFNSKLRINSTDIYITPGTYSHIGLQKEIQNQLDSAGMGINVSFATYQDQYTFSSTSTFTMDFTLSDPATYLLLGFNKDVYSGTTIVSVNSPQLRDRYFRVRIRSNSEELVPVTTEVLFPVVGSFKDNLVYFDQQVGVPVMIARADGRFNQISIDILDINGQSIDIRGGLVYMLLER